MPRSQDNLKIYEIDNATGAKNEIYDERQKTWIDLDDNDRISFIDGGAGFIMKSDKTGWSHLYLHDISGKLVNAITSGNFTVTSIVSIDAKSKQVYFTARKENSARIDYYKAGFNGKDLTRLSFGEYSHAVKASPSGKYFITEYSNLMTAPRLALADNKGKLVRALGDQKLPALIVTMCLLLNW